MLDTSLFHIAIVVYIAAVALDEIDIRDLLGRVAESRFQRIAMSLGDGLICTDSNYLITVWNPGADRDFRLSARGDDRPTVRRDLRQRRGRASPAFSIRNAAERSAGTVIEFDGRRSNGEVFPVEASFSGWQGTDGYQYRRDPARHLGAQARSREDPLSRGTRYADRVSPTATRFTPDWPR